MKIAHKLAVTVASFALGFAAGANPVQAASIVQNQFNGINQIKAFSPIGQTFTAEDPFIESIGFYLRDFNPQAAPNDFSVTVSLYEGSGTSGTLLGSGAFDQLVRGFADYADVNFSSVTLNPGSIYTAILSDDSVRWAVGLTNRDVYTGGNAIVRGQSTPNSDLRFRVLAGTQSQPVPEPFTIVGTTLAGGIGLLMRKLKSDKTVA